MDEAYLKSVEVFLTDAAAGREQKRAAYIAAREVAAVPHPTGDGLRAAFWAWLESGKWLQMVSAPDAHLDEVSPLNADKVRENYPYIRDFKAAEEKAIIAYDRRIRRALEHMRAGYPQDMWQNFLYSKPELREVREKNLKAVS